MGMTSGGSGTLFWGTGNCRLERLGGKGSLSQEGNLIAGSFSKHFLHPADKNESELFARERMQNGKWQSKRLTVLETTARRDDVG